MTAWFIYGVPVAALTVGFFGYIAIQIASRSFDRRHPQPAPIPRSPT